MRLLFSVLALFAVFANASASIITYDNRAAFTVAAGASIETIDFEGIPVGPLCPPQTPWVPGACEFSTGGVNFFSTVDRSPKYRSELSIDNGIGAPLSQGLVSNLTSTAPAEFYLDFASQFIGLDVIAGDGTPIGLALTEVNGQSAEYTIEGATGAGTFFGAYSPTGFSEMSLYALPENGALLNFLIDNVAVGQNVAVPEPGTLSLLLYGFGALLVMRHRRPRHSPRRDGCNSRSNPAIQR